MKYLRTAVCVVSLCSYSASQSAVARAQAPNAAEAASPQVEQARAHFQRGVELYQERNFEAALAEFSRAHELAANYRVLFNLGQVHVERHDSVAALKAFRRYLDEGGSDVPQARRDQVERDILMLKQRIAELNIRSNVTDADVFVGDSLVGKTPLLEPVLVNAGVLRVTVRKSGYRPETRQLTAVGAEKQDLDFTLNPEQSGVASAPVENAGPSRPVIEARRNMTPFWIGVGTTAAIAAGAGVFAILTTRSDDRLDDALQAFPGQPEDISDARSELKRNALVTDILTGGALVSAAVTIYFAVAPPTVHESRSARIGLRPYAGGTGLALTGKF